MKFTYKAKKGLDQIVDGTIEAQNQEEALNNLAADGFFPISIQEAGGLKPKISAPVSKLKLSRKKIKSKDILIFAQSLVTLLHAKVELISGLKTIYDQTDNARLKDVIMSVYNQLKGGKTFSEGLESFSDIFSPLFVNMVKAGEATGRLDYAFEQIVFYMGREEALKTKIKVALAYPVLLLIMGFCSIFVLISFVVPKLRPIFQNAGDQLPLITKIVLGLSDFSHKNWIWVAGAAAIILVFLYARKGTGFFRDIGKYLGERLPVIKRLIKNKELVNFTGSLSLLLNSGVVALKSLEISTRILDNPKLKGQMRKVYTEVASGQSLAKSMSDYTGLPKFFTNMISVGEESGRLGEVLDEISKSYNQQIEMDVMLISALVEPLLILFLGLILGTIVLAVLLPTFQITQMVR